MPSVIMLNVKIMSIMLSVTIMSIMLSVVILSVVMLNAAVPHTPLETIMITLFGERDI
jgi:hypothetical protein